MSESNSARLSTANTFIKAQATALLATSVDFVVYIGLVELFGVWYVMAAGIGAFCGAVCGFMLGRHWCFYAQDGHLTSQGIRYFYMSSMSLILNTSGVYLLTDIAGMHYIASKVFIAILVGVAFNFPMQRYFVFK